MSGIILLGFLAITCILYLIFSIILTVFGSIFLFLIQKRSFGKWELSKLESVLISYAIGVSIYLFIAYILDILQIFNFYFAYLSFIIVDILFLIYLYKLNILNKNLKYFKEYLNFNKENSKLLFILFLIIIGLQFLKILPRLLYNSSLGSSDPYSWTSSVFYALDHFHMNYRWFGPDYPAGFTLFCTGNLLIVPNNYIAFFFMKFACMPFITFFILTIFSISRRIFKESYLIFFTMIMVLVSNYFLQRTVMFLPSSISTLLISIALIIYLTKAPNYLIGFIIPAVYLLHSLSAIFFLMALVIFYFIKIIKSMKNRNLLKNNLNEIFRIILITFILLIPYVLHAFIVYDKNVIRIISIIIRKLKIFQTTEDLQIEQFSTFILILFNSGESILGFDRFIELFWKRTIGLFFLLAFAGLFLRTKEKDDKYKDIIILLKVGLILVFLVFYIPFLLNLEFIIENQFYDFTSYRIIETFTPHIIILSAIALEFLVKRSEEYWYFLKSKYERFRNFLKKHKPRKYNTNFKTSIIVLIISSSMVFYIFREKFYMNHHHFNFAETILYISENIPEDSNIGIPRFDEKQRNSIYRLLYNYDTKYYYRDNISTYENFYNFCSILNIKYVILKRTSFNETNLTEFDTEDKFIKIFQPIEEDNIYGLYKFEK